MVQLALAQIDCELGDVAANVGRVRETLAAAAGADLVVFPELALTGYQIGRVADDVALPARGPDIAGLGGEDDAFVVGFAEAGAGHTYNAAAYVDGGVVGHVHRKLYLPTYDVWEERKHFTPGAELRAFDTRFGRMAILLCADAWQPAVASLAVQDGARVLLIPANSAARRPDIEDTWHDITRFYARTTSSGSITSRNVSAAPPFPMPSSRNPVASAAACSTSQNIDVSGGASRREIGWSPNPATATSSGIARPSSAQAT